MKRIKKMASLLVSLLMVFGMGIVKVNAATQLKMETDLKISDIENSATVKLYKIWQAEYNDAKDSIKKWNKASGTNFADNSKPTAEEISSIAAGLQDGSISPLATIDGGSIVNGTYTYHVTSGASVYIAVITSAANSDTIYNPILLSAKYDGTSTDLSGATISTTSNYLYGTHAVAKSSKPKVKKELEATTDSTGTQGEHKTGSVGDTVNYAVTVTIPVYPSNAKNKTLLAQDTLSEGLTFKYETLKVEVDGKTYEINTTTNKLVDDNDEAVGTAEHTANGFVISFDYDKLNYKDPVVKYDAVINTKAVIGVDGNPNTFTLYYTNNPTKGSTYTTIPQNAEDIVTKSDKKYVYTYQISFKKTDDSTPSKALKGAVFGIYSDEDCTKLVDTVITNENGYASSSQVGYGKYYVKEISAPPGYTLNNTVYEVTSSWATVTTKSTSETVTTEYTTDKNEATNDEQVGWLQNNIFYNLNNKPSGTDVEAAYVKNTTTTTASSTTFTQNTEGSGVVVMEDIINTKNPELPSTGGMGTVIFTVLGAGLITIAVVLKLTRKRRS